MQNFGDWNAVLDLPLVYRAFILIVGESETNGIIGYASCR